MDFGYQDLEQLKQQSASGQPIGEARLVKALYQVYQDLAQFREEFDNLRLQLAEYKNEH